MYLSYNYKTVIYVVFVYITMCTHKQANLSYKILIYNNEFLFRGFLVSDYTLTGNVLAFYLNICKYKTMFFMLLDKFVMINFIEIMK